MWWQSTLTVSKASKVCERACWSVGFTYGSSLYSHVLHKIIGFFYNLMVPFDPNYLLTSLLTTTFMYEPKGIQQIAISPFSV